jgi:hypothetical protein
LLERIVAQVARPALRVDEEIELDDADEVDPIAAPHGKERGKPLETIAGHEPIGTDNRRRDERRGGNEVRQSHPLQGV